MSHNPQHHQLIGSLQRAAVEGGNAGEMKQFVGGSGHTGLKHGATGVVVRVEDVAVRAGLHYFCPVKTATIIAGDPRGDGTPLDGRVPVVVNWRRAMPIDGRYDAKLTVVNNNGSLVLEGVLLKKGTSEEVGAPIA